MKIRQKRADCPYYANLYAYAANTPVRYSDPTGMFDFDTNTIEAGDTLSQIAKDCNTRYGTNYTADDLQGFNSDSISDKNKIYAGNHLNLGKAEDVQKRAADYTSRATTQYSNNQVTPPKKINHGDFTVGLNLNFVPCIGIDASLGFVFDLDNSGASGLFLSGGFASGASVGGSVFAGYTKGDFEDSNIATLSAGYGLFGGSVGFADNGNISFSGGLSFGLKAGFNISKQHGFVIPFDTPAKREKSMERYYMHH